MVRYTPKNKEKSEYKTALGTTDYNIPMFGYRSAFLIFGAELVVLLTVSVLCDMLKFEKAWPITIFGALTFGLTIGYSQYFLERKRGFTKGFYLTVVILTLFSGIMFYLFLFKNVFI